MIEVAVVDCEVLDGDEEEGAPEIEDELPVDGEGVAAAVWESEAVELA